MKVINLSLTFLAVPAGFAADCAGETGSCSVRGVFAAGLAALCLLASSESKAIVFGPDPRENVEDFARERRLDAEALKRQHAASGLIRCGNARGAGQLTLATYVVTTAAHVFYDEQGRLRADSRNCVFLAEAGGQQITTAIDVGSIVAGTHTPYVTGAVHDWAVARLLRPLREATPYALGAPSPGAAVRFAARGHVDWGEGRALSLETCRFRQGLDLGAEGTREFAFDCAAGLGASGSALLEPAGARLLAIFVGFHTASPEGRTPFAPDNYNFAVTVEGAFRRAVIETAGAARAER